MSIERGQKWNPWDRKQQEPRVDSGPEDSGKGPLDKTLSRRDFIIRAGAAGAGLALAAVGADKFLNKDDSNEPTISDGGRPLPTSTPGPTPEATPYATPSPIATIEPSPTYTPTQEPSPTPSATPTEVLPTPTEVLPTPETWDGTMEVTMGSFSPEATGFETLRLNPEYPNGPEVARLIALYAHMYAEAVANNGLGDREFLSDSEIDELRVEDFEKRLLENPESCKYKLNAHTPENLRTSEVSPYLEVDPTKGLGFNVIVDDDMITYLNPELKGNAYFTDSMDFRYIVDQDQRLNVVLIMSERGFFSENAQSHVANMGPMYYQGRMPAGLTYLEHVEYLRGEKKSGMDFENDFRFFYYDLFEAPADQSSAIDGNTVVNDSEAKRGPVYPLFSK